MAKSVKLLPEFLKPPVVEVAVMIQYEAPTLEMVHLLHLWNQVREQFPGFEQAPAIPPAAESFEALRINLPQVQFQLMNAPPVPRMFFKKASDTELIQIQRIESDTVGENSRPVMPILATLTSRKVS